MYRYLARREVLRTLVWAILLAALVVGCSPPRVQPAQNIEPTRVQPEEAPDFELTNPDGQRVRLSGFRDKVVLMHFIYTRCATMCPMENRKLKSVYDALEEPLKDNLVVISVSFEPGDTHCLIGLRSP